MDDNDGLFLNIASDSNAGGDASGKKKLKVVGGTWRDRRRAQMIARGPKKADDEGSLGVNQIPVDAEKRAMKRRAQDEQSQSLKGPSKQARFSEGRGTNGKNNTFVSSLFTSNPGDRAHLKHDEDIEAHDASNAPLKDSTTFDGLGINEVLNKQLTEHMKLKAPTKIQRSVIPRLLTRHRDLMVQAQTGSGKTLSFVLPIFQQLMMDKDITRTSGIFALILTPTRELATQIYSVVESLSRCCHRVVPGIVIGGEKKKSEKARLRKGVNILVATPGRLADHIENTERLDLSQVRYVVMDEGDKLMELGFEETITKILKDIESSCKIDETAGQFKTLPGKRVNVLCSATIKGNVKKLGEISLTNAETVTSNSVPDQEDVELMDQVAAPDQLLQQVCLVPPKLRLVTLAAMLKDLVKPGSEPSRTIVFLSCSDSVNFHFAVFGQKGQTAGPDGELKPANEFSTVVTSPLLGDDVKIFKLHGSLSQPIRTATLSAFTKAKTTEHQVLFCTDVAARGLDLPYISTVIEYDAPFATEDHLHRIGRTARAGKQGRSMLFLLPQEEAYLDLIQHYHPNGIQHQSYEELLKTGFGKKWDVDATTWHLNVERWLLEDTGAHELAVKGFGSHIRSYATHLSSERKVFNVKALHLGHLAKSFGLRETPKKLGGNIGEGNKKKKENPKDKMFRVARMAAKAQSDEFNFM